MNTSCCYICPYSISYRSWRVSVRSWWYFLCITSIPCCVSCSSCIIVIYIVIIPTKIVRYSSRSIIQMWSRIRGWGHNPSCSTSSWSSWSNCSWCSCKSIWIRIRIRIRICSSATIIYNMLKPVFLSLIILIISVWVEHCESWQSINSSCPSSIVTTCKSCNICRKFRSFIHW